MKTNYLSSYLKSYSSVASIEVYFVDDTNFFMNLVLLKKHKSSIDVVSGEYHLMNSEALLNLLKTNIPVVLVISGRGIMHKKVNYTKGFSQLDYLKNAMPSMDPGGILIQQTLDRSMNYISIIRQGVVDFVYNEFREMGYEVLSISLGPLPVVPLWNNLKKSSESEISYGNHFFSFNGDGLINFEYISGDVKNPGIFRFLDQELSGHLVVPFAAGLCLMTNIEFPQLTFNACVENREEYIMKTVFRRLLSLLLVFFFLILSINSIGYFHYTSQTEKLDQFDIEGLSKELDILKKKTLDEKEISQSIFRPSPNGMKYHLSAYMDQLGASLPDAIVLNNVWIFPRKSKMDPRIKKPLFDFNKIQIMGVSGSGTVLNSWMEAIRKLDFCTSAEIGEYSSAGAEKADFTIDLLVK